MRHFPTILMATAGLALLTTSFVNADTPGRHPQYLKARSDLRNAQYVLRGFEPNVREHIHGADVEIDAAVSAIDQAAAWDQKPDFHPPVDHQFRNPDRFKNAMGFLTEARHDVTQEEDNPTARRYCDVAQRHIDRAMAEVKRAARDLHFDRELGW